jgi:hypothetical protein
MIKTPEIAPTRPAFSQAAGSLVFGNILWFLFRVVVNALFHQGVTCTIIGPNHLGPKPARHVASFTVQQCATRLAALEITECATDQG